MDGEKILLIKTGEMTDFLREMCLVRVKKDGEWLKGEFWEGVTDDHVYVPELDKTFDLSKSTMQKFQYGAN